VDMSNLENRSKKMLTPDAEGASCRRQWSESGTQSSRFL